MQEKGRRFTSSELIGPVDGFGRSELCIRAVLSVSNVGQSFTDQQEGRDLESVGDFAPRPVGTSTTLASDAICTRGVYLGRAVTDIGMCPQVILDTGRTENAGSIPQ